MQKKQVERFAIEHLLPSLPHFSVRGNLLFERPVGKILRAFLLENSGFSAATFYPRAFVQLLYIPSQHLTLSPGRRFPGNWKFEPERETQLAQELLNQIHEIGLRFLRAHATAEGIVRETRANPAVEVNPHARQQLAYSLLLLERNEEALDELNKILGMLNRSGDPPPWEHALFAEVGGLKERLMRNPREAFQTLNTWTEQTRLKLNLPA
jgi:hypothetical protein